MNARQNLGARFRKVQDRTHDNKPARAVIASRSYATPVHELWNALTDATRIARWFLPVSGNLETGGRYQLEGNAGGVITRCDPLKALDLTWEFAENVSWVALRLAAQSDETLLTLEHIMLKDEAAEEFWRQYGPGATGVGWDLAFAGLARHLENDGQTIDREANDAWMASKRGKAFMTDCAEAWGAAHIAAGEDADAARAMAAQTAAFYTGE